MVKYGHRTWQSRAGALNFIEHYPGRLFPHPISTKIESFIQEQVAKTSTTQNTEFSVVNYGPVDIILPCVFMFIKKRIKKYKIDQGQIIPGQQWNTFPEILTFLGNNLIHFLAVLWNCRKQCSSHGQFCSIVIFEDTVQCLHLHTQNIHAEINK